MKIIGIIGGLMAVVFFFWHYFHCIHTSKSVKTGRSVGDDFLSKE